MRDGPRTSAVDGPGERCSAGGSLPIAIVIDTEPDLVAGSPAAPWAGFEAGFDQLRAIRREFADRWGKPVVFNWMIRADLQIEEVWGDSGWAFGNYSAQLETLLDDGDFVGLHAHPIRDSLLVEDYLDERWTLDTMAAGIDAFESHFGRPPAAASWGRGWTSRAMLDLLSERGVEVDMSVFPGRDRSLHTSTVTLLADVPDLGHVPVRPYYPATPDWRLEADRPGDGTWVMPMTSSPVDGWFHPLGRVARKLRRTRLRSRIEHNYLLATTRHGFGAYVAELAGAERPYLTLTARSSRFLTTTTADIRRCFAAIERVCERHGGHLTDPISIVRGLTT